MSQASALPGPGARFLRGILPENPVLRQLIGMCPTLAVTSTMKGAVTMAGATTFVLVMSNLITSLLRKAIQPHMRILVFTVTIATFVTIADRFLKAFLPDMSVLLGPFVPLIIVNCIIIARAEVCASKQGPATAVFDGLGNGIGFLLTLAAMSSVRELLGNGTLWGWQAMATINGGIGWLTNALFHWQANLVWPNWTVMVLPPGAFITLAVLIGLANWVQIRKQKRQAEAAPETEPAVAKAA